VLSYVESSPEICTASTDGHLPFWRVSWPIHTRADEPWPFKLVTNSKVHQNAIKALDIADFQKGNDILTIVTGGDDNALGFTITHAIYNRFTFILRDAHAAAITGLCVLPESVFEKGVETFRVVSSSNDQRIKEWEVSIGELEENPCGKVEIRLVGDVFTAVADVGGVVVLRDGKDGGKKVLVVGNGMEVWNVSGI
jgi:hypothetical protein